MAYTFRHQPLKTLFFLYSFFLYLFVKVPYWTIASLLPSTRPRPSWTLSRTLTVNTLNYMLDVVFATCSFNAMRVDPKTLEGAAEANGLVWVDPTPELLLGEVKEIADLNDVSAIRIAGYWLGKRGSSNTVGQSAEPGEKVVYELHGVFLHITLSPHNVLIFATRVL